MTYYTLSFTVLSTDFRSTFTIWSILDQINWSTMSVLTRLCQLGRMAHYLYVNSALTMNKLERVNGIEPSHGPWQGSRLPLHHTRKKEPDKRCSQPFPPLVDRKSGRRDECCPRLSNLMRVRSLLKALRIHYINSDFSLNPSIFFNLDDEEYILFPR